MLISKYFHRSLSRSLIFCSLVTVQSCIIFFWSFLCFRRLRLFPGSPFALLWTSSDFRFRVWRFWKDVLAACVMDSSTGACHLSMKFSRSGVTTYSSVVIATQPTTKGRPFTLGSLTVVLSVLTGHILDSFSTCSPVRERSLFRHYIHQWRISSR